VKTPGIIKQLLIRFDELSLKKSDIEQKWGIYKNALVGKNDTTEKLSSIESRISLLQEIIENNKKNEEAHSKFKMLEEQIEDKQTG